MLWLSIEQGGCHELVFLLNLRKDLVGYRGVYLGESVVYLGVYLGESVGYLGVYLGEFSRIRIRIFRSSTGNLVEDCSRVENIKGA